MSIAQPMDGSVPERLSTTQSTMWSLFVMRFQLSCAALPLNTYYIKHVLRRNIIEAAAYNDRCVGEQKRDVETAGHGSFLTDESPTGDGHTGVIPG